MKRPVKPTSNLAHNEERLKDRRAYRETLIQRQAELEGKIARVEEEIKALRD